MSLLFWKSSREQISRGRRKIWSASSAERDNFCRSFRAPFSHCNTEPAPCIRRCTYIVSLFAYGQSDLQSFLFARAETIIKRCSADSDLFPKTFISSDPLFTAVSVCPSQSVCVFFSPVSTARRRSAVSGGGIRSRVGLVRDCSRIYYARPLAVKPHYKIIPLKTIPFYIHVKCNSLIKSAVAFLLYFEKSYAVIRTFMGFYFYDMRLFFFLLKTRLCEHSNSSHSS